jgi:predicted PurR-regulated permease PerM
VSRDPDRRLFRWGFWVLVIAGLVTLAPLWLPLLLAAWFAHLVYPIVDRLERRFGGRRRPAVTVAMLLFLVLLVPATAAVVQLIVAGSDLARRILESEQLQTSLQALVSDGEEGGFSISDLLDPTRILELVREHGGVALGFLKTFFGATATAIIHIFIFLMACYTFLQEGRRYWSWLVEHAPFDGGHMERMRRAFHETGRGIVVGVGLTALAQAIVATIAYAALGVPRAFLLGELTFFAAFIPSFGTALVWVPVAAGLALTQKYVAAIILSLIGVFVIGTIDNVLRPVFSRWGQLDLPVFVLLISIFGGFVVFGAWGFVVCPLIIRMAKEVLVIAREER